MNKKIFALVLALLLTCSVGAFSFGVGVQTDFHAGHGYGGLAVTFKLDKVPFVFAITGSFGSYYFGVGLTTDYWFHNLMLANLGSRATLHWFIGLGVYGWYGRYSYNSNEYWYYNRTTSISSSRFGVGGRVPIGLNFFMGKKGWIEPYIQIAPSLGFKMWSTSYDYSYRNKYSDKTAGIDFFVPLSLGIRFWV